MRRVVPFRQESGTVAETFFLSAGALLRGALCLLAAVGLSIAGGAVVHKIEMPAGVGRIYSFAVMAAAPFSAADFTGFSFMSIMQPQIVETMIPIIGFVALGIFTGIAIAALIGALVLLPRIKRLICAAERLGAGDLSARSGLRYSGAALGRLGRAFDRMAELLEQRQLEAQQSGAALAERDRLFRAAFESTNDVMMITDDQGRFLDLNFEEARMVGMTVAELESHALFDLLPAERSAETQQIWQNILEHGEGKGEYEVVHLSGQRIAVEYSMRANILPGRHLLLVRDISERKRAENALRASEERYRTLLAMSPEAIHVFNLAGQLILCNQMYATLLGFATPEELLGRNRVEFIVPEEHDNARATMAEVVNSGGARAIQRTMVSQSGARFVAEMNAALLRNGAGQPEAIIAVIRDVSDAQRARQELLQQQHELREIKNFLEGLIATSPGVIFRATPQRRWTYASPNVEQIAGFSVAEALTPGFWFSRIQPDDGRRILAREEQIHRDKPAQVTNEYRLLHKDGSYHWILSTLSYQWDEAGVMLGIQGFNQDITARKQAEDALRASESHFRAVFENGLNAMLILDEEGIILHANPAAGALAPGGAAAAIGRNHQDFIPLLDQSHSRPLWQEARDIREFEGEIQLVLADSQPHDIEYSVKANFIPGRHLVLINDVSERKRAEEARRSRQAAEDASQAKSEFLSRMSHELRTPLNAILGFAQLLEMDDLPSTEREYVDFILKGGQHLLNLINEVLDISRIEAGHLNLSIEPVEVGMVIEQSLALICPIAAQRKIRVAVEAAAQPGEHYVLADQQRLKQVLLNLLSNAVKYNHDGGDLTVSYQEVEAGQLRISVADSGIGISAANMGRLYQPFERLGAERTAVQGSGLGLVLSKSLVEAMDGQLGARSVLGQGSTFWLDLPGAVQPAQQLLQDDADLSAQPEMQRAKRTVLYIEDNLSNLRLIQAVLARHPDIDLLAAMQGGLGFDLAREHRPDLILLDLHLPDMHGLEVLQRLQQDLRTVEIPVVIISADATPQQIEQLRAAGAGFYLTKPLDVKRLLQVLEDLLYAAVSQIA